MSETKFAIIEDLDTSGIQNGGFVKLVVYVNPSDVESVTEWRMDGNQRRFVLRIRTKDAACAAKGEGS